MKVEIDGKLYVPAPPPLEGKNIDAALDVRFDSDAGDQLTVREYFRELLTTLWQEGEGFSGKRPFGNSDWQWDVFGALAKAGFIDLGPYDEDAGTYVPVKEQEEAAESYVLSLIRFALTK